MTWRIPEQGITPGEMPRPLEKPCLQLGSEQHSPARGRLARTGACPQAHPSKALHPGNSQTLRPSRGSRCSRRARGPEEDQASAEGARSHVKSPGHKTRPGPFSRFQHRGQGGRGNTGHVRGHQQGPCGPPGPP